MIFSCAKLNKWDKEARESPLNERENPPLLSWRFWLRLEGISLILVTLLGLQAVHAPEQGFSWRETMAFNVVYLCCAVLQQAYVWVRPKQRWKKLHASGALMDYFITPLRPFAILGPFVLAAQRRVFLSFFSFCLVASLGLQNANSLIDRSCFNLWLTCLGLCSIVICLYGPIMTVLEAAFWKRRFRHSFMLGGMIMSAIVALLYVLAFLTSLVLGSLFIDAFIDSVAGTLIMILVYFSCLIALFWRMGNWHVQKIFRVCEAKLAYLFESPAK